eukprot:scaffold92048_cov69-Phaeocystis_antarctica.AAC.2
MQLRLLCPTTPRHRGHHGHARPRVERRHHAEGLQALAQPHLIGEHAPAAHREGPAHALLVGVRRRFGVRVGVRIAVRM